MKNRFHAFLLFAVVGVIALAVQGAPPPATNSEAAPPDADVRIVETVKPQYPLNLQRQGVAKGEVRLLLEIDARGGLVDCLITAFTHKEFAYEARKAVVAWQFHPARIGGQPVSSVVPLTILFQSNGVLAVTRQMEPLALDRAHYDYAPCPARDLDRLPELISKVPPLYPPEIRGQGVTGHVAVDFYIDETGRVRFPVAREPADPRLAGLAVRALKLWMFEPPKRAGLPVLARASTSFAFDPAP